MDTNPLVENIGYVGSLLTSITFIPQVYKSWKSKSVGDLSIAMIVIVISSTIVWLIYGYLISSGPVLVANTVVLILTLVLLYFKTAFKKPTEFTDNFN